MSKQQKILIVDDNETVVELLKTQLKPFKYHLETAFDGEEALDKIRKSAPDQIARDFIISGLAFAGNAFYGRIRLAVGVYRNERDRLFRPDEGEDMYRETGH